MPCAAGERPRPTAAELSASTVQPFSGTSFIAASSRRARCAASLKSSLAPSGLGALRASLGGSEAPGGAVQSVLQWKSARAGSGRGGGKRASPTRLSGASRTRARMSRVDPGWLVPRLRGHTSGPGCHSSLKIPGAARRDASQREARCDACACPSLGDHELFFAPFSPSARDETRTRESMGNTGFTVRKSPDFTPVGNDTRATLTISSVRPTRRLACGPLPAASTPACALESAPVIAAVSLRLIDATGLASPDDAGSRVAGTRHAGRRAGRDALTVL